MFRRQSLYCFQFNDDPILNEYIREELSDHFITKSYLQGDLGLSGYTFLRQYYK